MKYKVIGWTNQNDTNFPDALVTSAMENTIIEEIKEKGFMFEGYHHIHNNCVPVLNTGEKCSLTARYFGNIMAVAQGDMFEHAGYMYVDKSDKIKYRLPKEEVIDKKKIVSKESLHDEYQYTMNDNQYVDVQDISLLQMDYDELFKIVDEGDLFLLKYKDKVTKRIVKSMETKYFYMTKVDTIVCFNIYFKKE